MWGQENPLAPPLAPARASGYTLGTPPKVAGEVAGETKSSVTRRLPTRSTNGRRVRARPAVAERIGARNGTGGAVLREIMRLGTHFWARRVWVDFRKVSWYVDSKMPWLRSMFGDNRLFDK